MVMIGNNNISYLLNRTRELPESEYINNHYYQIIKKILIKEGSINSENTDIHKILKIFDYFDKEYNKLVNSLVVENVKHFEELFKNYISDTNITIKSLFIMLIQRALRSI